MNIISQGNWTQGYATVGAGQTWGEHFWWSLENSGGVYKEAWNNKREVVGGNCHSVGVVGWTMGGGRGYLSSIHGAGADQLLWARIVLANGTAIDASYSENQGNYQYTKKQF